MKFALNITVAILTILINKKPPPKKMIPIKIKVDK